MTATAHGHLVRPATDSVPDLFIPGVTCVVPPETSREEWEAARAHGIGGSDIAAACGISTYVSPYRLWCEKTGRPVPPRSERMERAMYWGNLLEPVLRDEFQWLHPEYLVTPPPGTLAVTGMEHHRVNVDGLLWHPDGRLAGVLECKVGNHHQLKHWDGDDEIPIPYAAQVQWAMYVTGAPLAWAYGLLDSHNDVARLILRDDELIDELVARADPFWAHVAADIPPPIDGSDSTKDTLAYAVQRDGATVALDPGTWGPKLARRRDLHEQIKALEAAKAALDNELRFAMGEHTTALLDGERVATHKLTAPTRSTDYDRMQAEDPAAYAKYVTVNDAPERARRLDHSRSKRAAGVLDRYPTTTTTTTATEG